jgi:hypothetical protein
MKKILISALCLALTLPASAQALIQHPWQGKRVAYLGDSITDPRNKASQKKYWAWLQEWLGITPYVYGVSGRQWNDVIRQANQLKEELTQWNVYPWEQLSKEEYWLEKSKT